MGRCSLVKHIQAQETAGGNRGWGAGGGGIPDRCLASPVTHLLPHQGLLHPPNHHIPTQVRGRGAREEGRVTLKAHGQIMLQSDGSLPCGRKQHVVVQPKLLFYFF